MNRGRLGFEVAFLSTKKLWAMEPRISLITLGVANLERARAFYQRLGWEGQEVKETVFIQAGGIALVLWGREKLALDCGISYDQTSGFSGVVLAGCTSCQVVERACDIGSASRS